MKRTLFATALVAFAAISAAHAQSNYPTRAIRMVLPWPPGGGTNVLARIICARLSEEVRKVLALPDLKHKLVALGADIVGGSSEEFGAFIRAETARWAKVVTAAGIKAG